MHIVNKDGLVQNMLQNQQFQNAVDEDDKRHIRGE